MTIKTQDEDDKKKILKDGEVLRIPMFLMDGRDSLDEVQRAIGASQTKQTVSNGRGFLFASDAEQAAVADARAERDRRLVSAWKGSDAANPALIQKTARDAATTPSQAMAARDAAFAARLERQANAWKGAA